MIVGAKESDWGRRNPLHPGLHIAAWLEAADDYPGMTVSEAARKLSVSRNSLSRVVNGRAPVTPALALKMEALGWATADDWMRLQIRYDLAQARKRLNRPRAEAPAVIAAQSREAETAAEAA